MTVDIAASIAAWSALQLQLGALEDSGYRVPCADLTHLFVSDQPADRRQAIPWCDGCPARRACREYADAANESKFVWGGVDRRPNYRGEYT